MEDYLEAFPEEAEEYHNFLRRKKNSRKSKTIKEKRGKVRKATSDDNTDDGSDDGEGASDLDSEGDEGRATKNAREPVDECGDLSSDKESDDHRDSGDFDSPKREKKHRFSSSSSTKRKLLASKVPQSKRLKGKVTPRSQSSSQRYKVTPSPSTKVLFLHQFYDKINFHHHINLKKFKQFTAKS